MNTKIQKRSYAALMHYEMVSTRMKDLKWHIPHLNNMAASNAIIDVTT